MGKIVKKVSDGDSIFFVTGTIDEKYFAEPILSAEIRNQEFEMPLQLSYPQMYRTVFKSDPPGMLFGGGFYFFDNGSRTAVLDTSFECSRITGSFVNKEYYDRFLPYFYDKMDSPDCSRAPLRQLIYYDKKPVFDTLLLDYVSHYPDSYVALWFLIERIRVGEYSKVRDQIFKLFSSEIKNSNPWRILDEDLTYMRQMAVGQKFPALTIKDTILEEVVLPHHTGNYTLIDFWFARCKPCLATFPKLKDIHHKYQARGFEIVSISIDRTEEINRWKRTIHEQGLTWPQYLDENRSLGKRYNIHYFPTTFLLDRDGTIIKKNPTMEELDIFLGENL